MGFPAKIVLLQSLALLSALGMATSTEARAPNPSQKAFLAKFADMAQRGAADSMAEFTRFPLKNAVHQEPTAISRAGFKHHFQLNGYHEFAACLKAKTPTRAESRSAALGEWVVDCDGSDFYFTLEGGVWRHTGFENVNE